MAKTANELLQGILTTVSKIERKIDQEQKPSSSDAGPGIKTAMGIAGSLLGFGRVKEETKRSFISFMKDISEIVKDDKGKNFEYFSDGMMKISTSLPDFVKGLTDLGRLRTRRLNRAINTLENFYQFMYRMGDGRSARRVKRAINLFHKLGRALTKIAKPLRMISSFFLFFAVGIVAFAGALLLSSKLLKLSSPGDALLFLGFTVVSLVVLFGMLALARKVVDRGTDTIRDIGIGMVALSLGIVAFALTIRVLPSIIGPESGGSIGGALWTMLKIVGASVLMFSAIGLASGLIKKGTSVVFMMTLGMITLSVGIIAMATAARYLMGGALTLGQDRTAEEEKDQRKKEIIRGLGTMGIVVLASTAMFALLGAAAAFILPGIGVSIAMSIALLLLASSTFKLSKVAKELEGENIREQIGGLISGSLEGYVDGLKSLTGGKKGIRGIKEFLKNSALIFSGTSVLMAMSLTLSMFAKAVSAFANLGNMRVIKGYKENGEPIFGENINITNVADNISYTISTFLDALLTSTEGLTRRKAKAIKKMARALTGRRGILSGVIMFADALKTYAEFGERNEIGYITYDEEGNESGREYVSANVVVDNIISSFTNFTESLFNSSEREFGISGRQRRRSKRMSKALVGRHGILGAIIQFANTLNVFSKFGDNNEIPVLDANGNPIMENGKTKTIKVDDIADNIVESLTTFSDILSTKLERGKKTKDANKALKKYEKLIKNLNKLSSALTGLQRVTSDIRGLADAIGDLSVNLNNLNGDKLNGIMTKSSMAAGRVVYTNETRKTGSTRPTSTFSPPPSITGTNKSENWDNIAQMIGEQVGQKVAASIKNGQFVFEFDTTKSGGVYYWNPA